VRNARGIYLASRSIQKAAQAGRGKVSIPEPNIQAEIWQFEPVQYYNLLLCMDFQSVILKSNPKTAQKMGILCF
jgi:hypothetical protein